MKKIIATLLPTALLAAPAVAQNSVVITQSGAGENSVTLSQSGVDNQAVITQDGTKNTIDATQTGGYNRLERHQTGSSSTTIQQNDGVVHFEDEGEVSDVTESEETF